MRALSLPGFPSAEDGVWAAVGVSTSCDMILSIFGDVFGFHDEISAQRFISTIDGRFASPSPDAACRAERAFIKFVEQQNAESGRGGQETHVMSGTTTAAQNHLLVTTILTWTMSCVFVSTCASRAR